MLLGLVRESDGVDGEILQSLGADLSQVRERVIALLSGYSGESLSLASIDADLVGEDGGSIAASTLFGWEDAVGFQMTSLPLDARTERSELNGVLYETCTYRTRPPPEISVSVAGARVTKEAFDAYTHASLPDACLIVLALRYPPNRTGWMALALGPLAPAAKDALEWGDARQAERRNLTTARHWV